jgi:NAD(P)-dependent dehydrogenase (short-subunit alcohol dehydrogenase family)
VQVCREFNVNLFAPMELIRAFAAQPPSSDSDGPGRAVVNLLDRRIRCNDTSCVPYTVSKAGLEKLTALAALEYAPEIRINAVAPGPVLPPPGSPAKDAWETAGRVPLEALPSPENIAEAVLFLLKADSTTGQTVFVDGGQHLLGNGV